MTTTQKITKNKKKLGRMLPKLKFRPRWVNAVNLRDSAVIDFKLTFSNLVFSFEGSIWNNR
ncbi:hypothetical protein LEP1GSC079_5020 [Leptospira interrogans str. FPW1039]|uniref:Uncharacterized protein n=1 Tax=Leptospira interrogans str. FPW1039 TaxID=1193040 RepID=A0A0F6I8W6_LEPIR|nr:hypothetical protein LEP1GSC096_1061 [Leptospira interrogans serovar Hebdomadis str. R499]EKR84608.1 hypothetical protein LEP1GSC099_3921 [Leptospira interrogans str. UI 08452]EMJ34491.1 hypothetical protein LEP1GSC079_5020 [Leptospira interrogans str. FPW1039]EMN33836.1 hypothetical protein LEP1GSC084_1577 [Leptospira interrogans serovar Medanensis str. L0448]EMN41991.1 hypothetical protein LEP1GSC085_0686 [Leptospira interrogans str. L0996]EMN95876.1 hypothetical protein LEP1GSC110_0830 [